MQHAFYLKGIFVSHSPFPTCEQLKLDVMNGVCCLRSATCGPLGDEIFGRGEVVCSVDKFFQHCRSFYILSVYLCTIRFQIRSHYIEKEALSLCHGPIKELFGRWTRKGSSEILQDLTYSRLSRLIFFHFHCHLKSTICVAAIMEEKLFCSYFSDSGRGLRGLLYIVFVR